MAARKFRALFIITKPSWSLLLKCGWKFVFVCTCSLLFPSVSISPRLAKNHFRFRRCGSLFHLPFLAFSTVWPTTSAYTSSCRWTPPPIRQARNNLIVIWQMNLCRQCFDTVGWTSGRAAQHNTVSGVSCAAAECYGELRSVVWTSVSCCWRTRVTRCITARVLQTKVDAQCGKLATKRRLTTLVTVDVFEL